MNTMTINGHKAVITYDPDTDTLRKEGETSLRVYLDMCEERGIATTK